MYDREIILNYHKLFAKYVDKMKETKFNKSAQDMIEASDGYVIKTIVTNKDGTNDMLACIPTDPQELMNQLWEYGFRPYEELKPPDTCNLKYGRFVSLEGKVKGNQASHLQVAHQIKVIKAGGLAMTVKTLKDVLLAITWAKEGYIQPLPEKQLTKFEL